LGIRLIGVPDRKLRSNFTPGTTPWAMRRAQWSALGLSDEDLEKPKIAIVNSSAQRASCFSHLDEIVAPPNRPNCAFGLTLACPNAHLV
jgi:dihydroxyacid dehydratase/phosphogluconate dehydratase